MRPAKAKTASALALLLALALAAPLCASPDFSPDALLRDHLWRQAVSLPKERRPKLGLVLSAGSLRATAHVGVISVLENAGFPVDMVAGTSMGAVLGSLYAGGVPVPRLWKLAGAMSFGGGSNLNAISAISLALFDKLLSSKKAEKFINDQIGGKRFEDLPKPFACVAMDLYSCEAIIFREGAVAIAVRASMNLPGVFAPVEYRHRYLVDGGVVDYIPVDAARLLGAEWVLASVAQLDYTHTRPKNVLESLEQVIDIRGSLLSDEQRKRADFVIEPPVGDIPMGAYWRNEEAISKGVIAANKQVNAARESYILFALPRMMPDFLPSPRRSPKGGR